jgi:hypothetical protein
MKIVDQSQKQNILGTIFTTKHQFMPVLDGPILAPLLKFCAIF